MCGRYVLYASQEELIQRFDARSTMERKFIPDYNIAPGSYNPVVIRNSPNRIVYMLWGLVPKWAKDPKIGYQMINARSESLTEKPSFKPSFNKYRCLIPANGFYEWKKFDNYKIPYYIHEKNSGLVSFAGLYSAWSDAEGKKLLTYTIVTTKAVDEIKGIHDRMPVILSREGEEIWLNKESTEDELLNHLKVDLPLDFYKVSSRVGNAGYKDADLLNRV